MAFCEIGQKPPLRSKEQPPSLAVTDVKAAGRCLAFDLPTSAGFHIARAVETVLLQYFSVLNIDRPDYKNLGRYIETLKDKGPTKGIDEKVIAALDQFRDLYRNPIMHPDVNLSADEALILFANAQSAISAIIRDMEKITTAKSAAELLMGTGDSKALGDITPVAASAATMGGD